MPSAERSQQNEINSDYHLIYFYLNCRMVQDFVLCKLFAVKKNSKV